MPDLAVGWRRRLTQPSLVTIGGNAAYAASQLGVLIVLARLTTTAEVGRYALALAVSAPIQIGLGMRLRTARVIIEPTMYSLRTYFAIGLPMAIAAIAVSTAVAGWAIPDPRTRLVVLLIAASKGIESLIDISYGERQRCGQMLVIAKSQALRGLLTLVAATLGALIDRGVVGAAVAINMVWLAQLLTFDIRRMWIDQEARTDHPSWLRPAAKLAGRAWPLGLAAAMTSFIDAAPRYVVSHELGTEQLGIFAVLAYPTMVMSVFANSLGQANLSELRDAFLHVDLRRLRSLKRKMSILVAMGGLAAGTVLLLLGPDGMTFVFGATYGRYFRTSFLLLGVAVIAGLATISYYVLTCTGRFMHQSHVMAVVALFGIPTTWLTTGLWGLAGAACGMMLTLGLQWALTALMVRRQLQDRVSCPRSPM